MFNARLNNESRVCIFDFDKTRKEELRRNAAEGKYRCPACDTLLSVRLGEKNRWHFSHKGGSPDNCPLKHTSYLIFDTVKAIYNWLKIKSQVKDISVEYMPPEDSTLPPIDIFFRTDKKRYLYKVTGKRIVWETLKKYEKLRHHQYCLNYIITNSSIKREENQFLFELYQRDCYDFIDNLGQPNNSYVGNFKDQGYLLAIDSENENFHKFKHWKKVGESIRSYTATEDIISFDIARIKPSNGEIVF